MVWRRNLLEANHGGGILMQSTMHGQRRIFRDGGEIGGGFKILEAEFFRGAFGVPPYTYLTPILHLSYTYLTPI